MRGHGDLDLIKEQATETLRTRHHIVKGKPNDFRILAQEAAAPAARRGRLRARERSAPGRGFDRTHLRMDPAGLAGDDP